MKRRKRLDSSSLDCSRSLTVCTRRELQGYQCRYVASSRAWRSLSILCLLLISLVLLPVANAQLILNLTSRGESEGPIKYVSFCHDCPAPDKEGSITKALNAKFGLQQYSVTGELVYCIPNHAERPRILNSHQLDDRIIFVDRGKVSLLEKILRIQQQTEAIGIIVADDGVCDEDFVNCGPRAGSASEGGFAAHDSDSRWKDIEIPVLLVSSSSAERIRKMMGITQIKVKGVGLQNMTTLVGDGGRDEL